jgi:hypothetical protein
MNEARLRSVRRSKLTSSKEVAELLQLLLVAELLYPSRTLWLVSPWISDVPVLDNTVVGFSDLEPKWGATRVRLSEVLLRLARSGTTVVVATRVADDHNKEFLGRLESLFFAHHLDNEGALIVKDDADLHEKGMAGDDFHLGGSMNLTWTGIHLASEFVTLFTEPSEVQRARRSYAERYGGTFREGA